MSQGLKLYKVASDAIEKLANTTTVPASDRAMLLARLRTRTSDLIVNLGQKAEQTRTKREGGA